MFETMKRACTKDKKQRHSKRESSFPPSRSFTTNQPDIADSPLLRVSVCPCPALRVTHLKTSDKGPRIEKARVPRGCALHLQTYSFVIHCVPKRPGSLLPFMQASKQPHTYIYTMRPGRTGSSRRQLRSTQQQSDSGYRKRPPISFPACYGMEPIVEAMDALHGCMDYQPH